MENAFKYETNYYKEIYNINNLYTKLNNELNTFYININQEDTEKNIWKKITQTWKNSIEEIVFKYFYKNADETINNINENIIKKGQKEKGKENYEAKKGRAKRYEYNKRRR